MYLDPKRTELPRYFDYYEDRLDALFNRTPPTVANGLGYLGAANVHTRLNFFKVITDFFKNSFLSDLPLLSAVEYNLVDDLTTNWAIAGEYTVIRQAGQLKSVRSDFVVPVFSRYDRTVLDRILLVYPERNVQDLQDFGNVPQAATRALVIEWLPATNEAFRSIREYRQGYVADGPLGQKVPDIDALIYRNISDSLYRTIEPLVFQISVRANLLNLALNTSAVPLIEIDKNNIQSGRLLNKDIAVEDIKNIVNSSGLGLTVQPSIGNEEAPRFIERSGNGLRESLEYIQFLVGQLAILSGLPVYVITAKTSNSRVDTEASLFSAQSRVNSFKLNLVETLASLGLDIAIGVGDSFNSKSVNIDNNVKLLNAGIITAEEARAELGFTQSSGETINQEGN